MNQSDLVLAHRLLMAGQPESVLELGAGSPESTRDPRLLFLRGAALAQLRRFNEAVEEFDRSLDLAPDVPLTLFHRALALNALERSDEALGDFKRVATLDPGSGEAHANAGVLLLRADRHEEAVVYLRRATALLPNQLGLQRSLANALRGSGALGESLALHARVASAAPDDPAALTDHALALTSAGELGRAKELYRRALAIDARDQTALAGIAMIAHELGQDDEAAYLLDYPRLLGFGSCLPQDGLDMGSLRELILGDPRLAWEPLGRTTRMGQQSPMLDLDGGPELRALRRMLERFVHEQMSRLKGDEALQGHPWVETCPAEWRLQAWSTVLQGNGHQDPHIHPAGWMSGVFYLDPATAGSDGSSNGALVFGHAPSHLGLGRAFLEREVKPQPGQIICFPSYTFHHTRPYQGERPRISIAFDVLPGKVRQGP